MWRTSTAAPSSWKTAASGHLLLLSGWNHRQVVGSDVNSDGNEDGDKADPEPPIVMRAPPVRDFAVMAMVTLSVGMGVFSVVHSHADLREKRP